MADESEEEEEEEEEEPQQHGPFTPTTLQRHDSGSGSGQRCSSCSRTFLWQKPGSSAGQGRSRRRSSRSSSGTAAAGLGGDSTQTC